MQSLEMFCLSFLPWWDVAALLHEGAQGKPKRVKDAEFIGLFWTLLVGVLLRWCLALLHPVGGCCLCRSLWLTALLIVLCVPLIWAESTDKKEDDTDANVRKHNAHPDLVSQRVQEGKHARFGFGGFLDHDGNTQRHEGLREVDHFFTDEGDCERSHSQICFLGGEQKDTSASKHRYLCLTRAQVKKKKNLHS